ncbi:MAG: MFS transporter [Ignavibacteria bacterium]|nr:MFS transporter [Ignavibacteria bacterium]
MTSEQNLRRNIPLLYAIQALRYFMVALPTLVLFYRSVGLSMQDIMVLQASFSVAMLALEIPSGYFSDRLGRRRTIIIGVIGGSLGFGIYCFASGFWMIFAAEIVLGFGASFISGTDSAMTFDTLAALGETKRSIHAEGRQISFGNFSEAIAGVLGGLLAGISLMFQIYVQFAVISLAIPLAFLLTEPPRRALVKGHTSFHDILMITRFALIVNVRLRSLIVFSGIVGASTLTMVWFIQPYMLAVGVPIAVFGAAWTTLNFTVGWFSMNAHRFETALGARNMIIILAVTSMVGYLILGIGMTIWFIPALLIFYFVRGINNPIFNTYINREVPDDRRATVLSVRQMIVRIIFSIVGPLVGWVSDSFSLGTALLISGGIFGVLGVSAAVPLLWGRGVVDVREIQQ